MENPFKGRPNESVLEKKRDEYIEQAVARMNLDKKFVSEMDRLIKADRRIEAIEEISDRIIDTVLDDHYVDEDTSKEKTDKIEKEYPGYVIGARAEKWEVERAKVLGVQEIL